MSEKGNGKSPKHIHKVFEVRLGVADSFLKKMERPIAFFELATIVVLALVSFFFDFVLINSDALKALIEAEATVLGFFGLMAVYWLTSIDSRIDRLEQEKHEVETELRKAKTYSVQKELPTPSELNGLESENNNLNTQIEKIQDRKEILTNDISKIGAYLVISLVASIALLGFQSTYADAIKNFSSPFTGLVSLIAEMPMMLFLVSIYLVFGLLRRMGKKPKAESGK